MTIAEMITFGVGHAMQVDRRQCQTLPTQKQMQLGCGTIEAMALMPATPSTTHSP